MVLHGSDGAIIDCNPQAMRILGLTRSQILGRTSRDSRWRAVREDGSSFPGEEHPAMIALKSGRPCRRVVMGLHLPKGILRWININAQPLFQNDEAKPHAVVVTFSDITEQNEAEAKLADLEARYHDLYENAPDMYLSVDSTTGRVIQCNQTFLNATGHARDEIIGRQVFELYQPESRPVARDALKRFIATGSLRNLELILKCKDGSALPISLNSTAVRDKQGRIVHSRSILRDVSQRKQVEAALRRSEERFRAIANFSPDIISIFDNEGRLIFNSAAANKIHGYQGGELENRSTFELIHPDDRLGVTEAFGNLLKVPGKTVNVQYRYRNADGSYIWMEAIACNELANSQINGVIAISRDITARKQTEAALAETTERLSLAQQAGRVGVFDWNLVTNDAVWTPELEEIFGLPSGGFEGRYEGWRKRVHPEDLPAIEAMFAKWLKSRRAENQWEYRYLRHEEWRWISARGRVMHDGWGRPVRMIGTNVDITAIKQVTSSLRQLNETLEQRIAERTAALRASEERFRSIAANTPDHILIQDRNLRYQLVINPQLGLTEADMIGKTDWDLFKKTDATRLMAIKKKVLKTGKPIHVEIPFPNFKGEIEYFEGDYIPRRDGQGRVDGLIGYFRNVSKRKLVEQKSEENEAKFFAAFKNSPAAMNISRADNGLVVDANDAFFKVTGYSREETINATIKALNIWVEPKYRAQALRRVVDQGSVRDLEFEYRKKDGRTGIGIFSAQLIHFKDTSHFLSAVNDISERKQAEIALRQSEEHYRKLFIHSRDAFLISEAPSWKFTAANPAAVEMFRAKNVQQLLSVVPWELSPAFQPNGLTSRQAASIAIHKAMKEGSHSFEWRHQRLNGEEFPAMVLLARINIEGRTVLQGTVRDITEQVRLEQEVLSISDHERRRLAQDLHDGLGQILAGASFLTNTAYRNLAKDSIPAAKPLERIQEVIDEAITQARNLAHDIQPVEPDPGGLQASLEKLAAQTREIFNIRCDFRCRRPILVENEKVATNLFRIAQEAVTNALKHGKPKHIRICLAKKNKQIHLTVADNGSGITSRQSQKTGMGLRIMNYRARLIGGAINLKKNPGGGTIVECSLLSLERSKHGKNGKQH